MLIIFSGLPGTGKTTIARSLAHKLAAVYLRIDSLEQALRKPWSDAVDAQRFAPVTGPALASDSESSIRPCAQSDATSATDLGPTGYFAAYAIAADNLCLGLSVVADSVNPLGITRDAWRNVALETSVPFLEIETICSDPAEHRRRVEERANDIPGLVLPSWQSVLDRKYEPWEREHLVLDTAALSVGQAVEMIIEQIS